MKALAIINFAYVACFAPYLIDRARTLLLHFSGRTHSPWIVRAMRVADMIIVTVIFICAGGCLRFSHAKALGFAIRAPGGSRYWSKRCSRAADPQPANSLREVDRGVCHFADPRRANA